MALLVTNGADIFSFAVDGSFKKASFIGENQFEFSGMAVFDGLCPISASMGRDNTIYVLFHNNNLALVSGSDLSIIKMEELRGFEGL